jgi:hypothetical protein
MLMNQSKCQQLILALWIEMAIPTKGSSKRLAHAGQPIKARPARRESPQPSCAKKRDDLQNLLSLLTRQNSCKPVILKVIHERTDFIPARCDIVNLLIISLARSYWNPQGSTSDTASAAKYHCIPDILPLVVC